ncbi:MAG TPA: aminotransferase class IV [Cryomorphaceae bacterium]|nr:aminotransferase class IV [Cryomorphaceae bacterium]
MSNRESWIVLNGALYDRFPSNFALHNRAFRLGDGFFETIRIHSGKIHNWKGHFSRLTACCQKLKITIPGVYSSAFLEECIKSLLRKNGITNGGRVRLTCYRDGDGTYRPTSNRLGFLIEAHPLPYNDFKVNDTGLSVGVYRELTKAYSDTSRFKMLGNQVYIQASIWAQEQNFHDALIVNPKQHIIEATSSNLFLIKDKNLFTPSLDDGCIGGIMRMSVINAALNSGMSVFESQLVESDLLDADEIFITNSISGIQWVGGFKSKRYYHKISDKLIEKLNEKEPALSSD